jgi:hypothetical protein
MDTAAAARVTLMAGRVVVGGGTLVAPRRMGAAFGIDPADNPAASYVGRLFGVRALLQVALLVAREDRRRQLRWGVAVDLVDAAAALAAARSGDLARRPAALASAAALGEAALGCVALTAGRGSPRR